MGWLKWCGGLPHALYIGWILPFWFQDKEASAFFYLDDLEHYLLLLFVDIMIGKVSLKICDTHEI